MSILIPRDRLTPGVSRDGDTLTIPATGGGVWLSELASAKGRYLNLTLEVLEEHSMAFELRVYADEDAPRVIIRFGLLPRLAANIAIDLDWLDGHVLFPGHTPGELKVVCHGSRIARGEITRAELVAMPAYHAVRARLTALALSDTPAAPTAIPPTPLIDELGQYIPKAWPGKTPDVPTLCARLRAEADGPERYPFADWTEYGGYAGLRLTDGTGYFASVKRDGRWYLTDPMGYAFFSMGPDCVGLRADARVDGVEPLLRWLPSEGEPAYQDMQVGGRDFGEVRRGPCKLFSFGRANMRRAFGEDWEGIWRRMIVGQLKRCGMNTLGNWSDAALYGRMPYVTSLPRFPETAHKIFRDFPDVLSPEYARDAETCAQALAERRDDPMMIGYFLRNEPSWAFVDDLVIAREVLRDTEDTCCKRALIAWLGERYGDVAALNRAWGLSLASFDDLARPVGGLTGGQALDDLRAFSARLIEAYTSIPAQACRRVDAHHMILGMRWAWISDPALIAGWKNFDVFSINCYAVDPTSAIQRVAELGVDLPVMIGEFHFGALDAGLTATGLEAVPSQRERGIAYRYYTERVAAHPNGVGCHYFQCYDQFALGRFDGENYNIGLFDICLQPYEEMMRQACACAETVYAVREGRTPPTDAKPTSLPMIAY